MAEHVVSSSNDDEEDIDFEHEERIVDRVLDNIAPNELPCDVDALSVAYFLWLRLTAILLACDHSVEKLVSDVREEALVDAEPEGNA